MLAMANMLEIEGRIHQMDGIDVEKRFQDDIASRGHDTVGFLVDATNALIKLVMEYAEASKGEDQLESRRKLKEIQRLGYEIAHVAAMDR